MLRSASSPYLTYLLAASATCGIAAAYAYATTGAPEADVAIPMIPQPSTLETEVEVPVVATVRQTPAPREMSRQLLFVFQAENDTYVKLSSETPAHGKRRLVDDDHGTITIAEVAPASLPREWRDWRGKEVVLDRGCTARVTGFAVVTRLVGDPGYAGLDDTKWKESTAARAGATSLAARISAPADCWKDALYARDAALAPILALDRIEDADLAEAAHAALLAGDAAKRAQASVDELGGGDEGEPAMSWVDHATFDTRVLRHPTTGVTWVMIHAIPSELGCGGPQFNVFGLYKVGPQGDLITVEDRSLESVFSIDRIIDLDHDGALELVGHDWLGMQPILATAAGDELDRLELPFYGCPC